MELVSKHDSHNRSERAAAFENEFPGSQSEEELLKPVVRHAQIITFALIQGVMLVAVIGLFLNQAQLNGKPEILTWIAVGFAVLALLSHLVVPTRVIRAKLSVLSNQDLKNRSEQENVSLVAGFFQTLHIIACAILEGAAMFCAIAYLVEQSWYSIAAAAVMLLLIAARFPSTSGIRYWVENRIREIQLK